MVSNLSWECNFQTHVNKPRGPFSVVLVMIPLFLRFILVFNKCQAFLPILYGSQWSQYLALRKTFNRYMAATFDIPSRQQKLSLQIASGRRSGQEEGAIDQRSMGLFSKLMA